MSDGMENSRKPNKSPALAMFVPLAMLLSLGLYIGGYFWLGGRNDWQSKQTGALVAIERYYGRPWLALLFKPAGWVEQQLRGVEVEVRAESSIRMSGG